MTFLSFEHFSFYIFEFTGIDGSILFRKQNENLSEASKPSKKHNSKKGNTNTLTHAAKKKQQKEVVVLDYTKKRGSGKKRDVPDDEENISQLNEHPSQVRKYFELNMAKNILEHQ